MTFSLRRKRPTTLRRVRRTPTAATISVVVCLLWGGAAAAQTGTTDPAWSPVGQAKPLQLPASFQKVEPVQFKPAQQPPTPLPQDKVAPPPLPEQPGRIMVPQGLKNKAADDEGGLIIRTDSPGLDRLTRRWSEEQFFESLRQDARRRPGMQRVYFPEEEVSTEVYAGRQSPKMIRFVEPYYVVHGRLLFEQKNFERYGWDIGPLSPAFEFATYYYDLAMLPYHVGSHACSSCDTSAGKCLPGDATPFVIYREPFSITGLVFEGAALFGGWVLFP
jgi:hypothetical protein